MAIRIHQGDLPGGYDPGESVAIDTETMGLEFHRDRLCLVQLSTGDGNADLVQISAGQQTAPVLSGILTDPNVLKIMHFARFDIAALMKRFGVMSQPVYCTKIASFLARTYSNQHGLKALVQELLNETLDKASQSSDWGGPDLTDEQCTYAAHDVIFLHQVKRRLDAMLKREEREDLVHACFEFLPTRAALDLAGWSNQDIFAH